LSPLVLVRQRRSAIGEKEAARRTLVALGLGRPGARAAHEDSAALRGMLRRVAHLVAVEQDKGVGRQ
jgi:large subunit ribosomal protein L30